MNFKRDLRLIAEKFLSEYSLKYEGSEDDIDIIRRWVNYEIRTIHKKKRNVINSSKIKNNFETYTPKVKQVLKILTKKFENGKDVFPYLSKTIDIKDYTDYLFCDWKIYHLHLSSDNDPNNPKFMRRSDKLLFCCIDSNNVYFIDVRSHDEEYLFAQKELLRIIHDGFPRILEPYRMKNVIDIEFDISDSNQIDFLRKNGANISHKIGDDIYLSMGGGITTAKTSVRTQKYVHDLIYMTQNMEKCVNDNRSLIEDKIKNIKVNQKKFDFRLIVVQDEYKIMEIYSKFIL